MPSECLIRCLYAVFHPDRVSDVAVNGGIQVSEKLNRRLPVSCRKAATGCPFGKDRALRRGWNVEVRLDVSGHISRIAEREGVRVPLDEELERIEHAHVGHHADGDVQLAGIARKDRAR